MSSVSALNSLLSSSTSSTSSSPIDISSLLSAATGATSTGIDVTAAVNAAIYAAQAPERQWQAQQATVKSQITALTTIQTAVSSLSSDLNTLGDLNGPLAARTVSSSSSAVTATAASGATLGTHSVSVSALATAASWYSPAVSSATAALNPMQLQITAANGATSTFTTGSGVNSLNDLAAAINAGSSTVSASVVTDSSGARLALVGTATGAANDFSVSSSDPTFNPTRASTATDASLTVDGVPITSASNTVTGAITGVTLSLAGTTATTSGSTTSSNPVSLAVGADQSQIATAMSSLVTDYNSALSQVNAQFSFDSTSGSQGVLSGDATLRTLQSTLMNMANYNPSPTTSSSATSSLAALGITMGDDGSLSLNTDTLSQAVSSNSNAVQNFFQGTALNGFAQTIQTSLNAFTNPATGALAVGINNLNTTYTSLQSQVNDYESGYIASQKTVLTAMYSQAEIALQSLPATLKQLQAQLGNNSGS